MGIRHNRAELGHEQEERGPAVKLPMKAHEQAIRL